MTLSAPERAGIEEMVLADIYVLQRGQLSAVLAPDSDNIPTLCDPQPHVTCFEYLPLGFGEAQLVSARGRLGDVGAIYFWRCRVPTALRTAQGAFSHFSGHSMEFRGGVVLNLTTAVPR